jgi:hypothetical protein
MLDRPVASRGVLRAERSAPLPVAGLILGKQAEEAASLLPRLFNLCRTAQSACARLAFGLPLGADHAERVRQEVLREHLIKFCVTFPPHWGAEAMPLPDGWQRGTDTVRRALFGPAGTLPVTTRAFVAFLEAGQGIAGSLLRIRDGFAPGEACGAPLPRVTASNAMSVEALENSVAGRQACHPVLRSIEDTFGRGPLWRATARAYDAQDCMNGDLPDLLSPRPGVAIVPAARGTYAIDARVEDGIVTGFRRITPTDHLLVQGGILDQALASLPRQKTHMAALVLDILDPCTPVRLREVDHA